MIFDWLSKTADADTGYATYYKPTGVENYWRTKFLSCALELHLQNKKLHGLYLPPNTKRATKSEIMIWEGHVFSVG
jgi:hypothetical protein